MNSKTFIFSIIAGLASALLAAVSLTHPGLLTLFIYVTSVPIFAASLAWGSLAGFVAASVTILSTGFAASMPIALFLALLLIAPAAYAGHLAGLSRLGDDGKLYWFPLSGILFRLALFIAVSTITIGLWFGYDATTLANDIGKIIRDAMIANGDPPSAAQETAIGQNLKFVTTMLPMFLPANLLIVLVWNMKVAEKLVRAKATMRRPKDNIPADSGLPKMAMILFGAAVVVALLVPSLQNAAFVVVGTMGMAIALIGMAVMHYFTWGRKGRAQILFLAYMITITISLPLALFLAVGLAELVFYLRARDPDRMPPNLNT